MISRREFIKFCSVSASLAAVPMSMVLTTARTQAASAGTITYPLSLNSGGSLLLNSGDLLLLAQEFPGPFDSDGDGLSDQLEVLIGTDAANLDSDGDTLSDGFEVGYDGDASSYTPGSDLNPLATDTDGDSFSDDVEVSNNSDPLNSSSIPATGDINDDGVVNAGDLVLANRMASGNLNPTTAQLIRGDVAPLLNGVPAPDGVLNAADLLVISRKVLGLTSF